MFTQLGQGEAAGVIRGCPGGLLLVPDRPRRREGVVAVAHGVQERRVATPQAVHRRRHRVNGFASRDVPAAHAATALHQVEIVGGRHSRSNNGSITVPAGSSMSTRMCGVSKTASRRTAMRAGNRLGSVPSVLRINVRDPAR